MQFPVATHISICLSSTLNCPLIAFLEYPGLLPMHSPYCSQSDLFELKILSCHLPSNSYFNHFEVFPLLLREILKSETWPTSLEMSLSPIQSNFTCSVSSASFNCTTIFCHRALAHPVPSVPHCLDSSPPHYLLMSFVWLISFP